MNQGIIKFVNKVLTFDEQVMEFRTSKMAINENTVSYDKISNSIILFLLIKDYKNVAYSPI